MIDLKLHDNASHWMTGDYYLSHINEREYYCRKFNKCPWPKHNTLKHESAWQTKQLKLSLQRSYFDEALWNASSVKRKWQIIKEFWPHLSKKCKIDKINDVTDDKAMAEIMNNFFAEIGIKLAEGYQLMMSTLLQSMFYHLYLSSNVSSWLMWQTWCERWDHWHLVVSMDSHLASWKHVVPPFFQSFYTCSTSASIVNLSLPVGKMPMSHPYIKKDPSPTLAITVPYQFCLVWKNWWSMLCTTNYTKI